MAGNKRKPEPGLSTTKEELAEEKVNLDSLKSRADELERELSQRSALFKESNQAQN